jgi:hypothetical protein
MERVVAADGVFRHPDLVAKLVGIQDRCPDTGVQMNAGQQQEIDRQLCESPVQRVVAEGAEERLVNERLAWQRGESGGGGVTLGSFDAGPVIPVAPVRHPMVVFPAHRRPDMEDRDRERPAALQQGSSTLDHGARRRVESGDAEVVVLEVNQQECRLHSSGQRRRG